LALRATDALEFEYADLSWDAAFIAGKAFVRYRRESGVRRSPLPDFYIGAHALAAGMTLLTRDGSRCRNYFPKRKILAP
jgi:predicted nucleic acid-binding protein